MLILFLILSVLLNLGRYLSIRSMAVDLLLFFHCRLLLLPPLCGGQEGGWFLFVTKFYTIFTILVSQSSRPGFYF